MSTFSGDEPPFVPSESTLEFLSDVVKLGFGWIAAEIYTVIRHGRTEEWDPNGVARPYDEFEQDRIIIQTLQNYFVVLNKAWNEARDTVRELLDVDLSPTEWGYEQDSRMFPSSSPEALSRLDDALRKAWPRGPEPYDPIS